MADCLQGVTVIEMGHLLFGPLAATHLADLGAEVIKIEPPERGDFLRGTLAIRHLPTADFPYPFENAGRNKRSVALDLEKPAGIEIAHRLIEKADVFLANYHPDRLAKRRLDYATLYKINPALIYVVCTGWGLKGPDRHKISYDYLAWARSGLMAAMGEAGTPPPQLVPGLVDSTGGLVVAYGIMSALFHRERTGVGQQVHASLLSVALTVMGAQLFQAAISTGRDIVRESRKEPGNPTINAYPTKDGKWFQICGIPERMWPGLCELIGMPELQRDPRFSTLDGLVNNSGAVVSILDSFFLNKTLEECGELLDRFGIPWAPMETFGEICHDPQVLANDNMIVDFDHPMAGRVKFVGYPVEFSETPASIRRRAPELGEHTEEVLLERGYTWEDIARFKEQGAII